MRPRHEPPRLLSVQPFSRSDALATIGRGTLSGPAYVRLARGAYWLSAPGPDFGRRIQALRVVLPPDAVLAGQAAAFAQGAASPGAAELIEVISPRRLRHRPGMRLRTDALLAGEVIRTPLGPATSPARTAFDFARRPPLLEAIARVDAVLHVSGTALSQVAAVLQHHPGSRGVQQARRVLALADPRSESPRETLLRVRLTQAGLPPPVPQFVVRDGDGRFVARLDLAWPQVKVGVEYDGAHHREPRQHSRDLARHNLLRAAGWVVLQVDSRQLARFDDLAARLARLLGA
jgi:hypothetical protein